MPFYDYACERCGPFTAFREMAAYEAPLPCPECGASASRALLTAPRIGRMDQARLAAHATNERSAHEPRRSHAHGPGCGCSGRGIAAAGEGKPRSKGFSGRRPWMISH